MRRRRRGRGNSPSITFPEGSDFKTFIRSVVVSQPEGSTTPLRSDEPFVVDPADGPANATEAEATHRPDGSRGECLPEGKEASLPGWLTGGFGRVTAMRGGLKRETIPRVQELPELWPTGVGSQPSSGPSRPPQARRCWRTVLPNIWPMAPARRTSPGCSPASAPMKTATRQTSRPRSKQRAGKNSECWRPPGAVGTGKVDGRVSLSLTSSNADISPLWTHSGVTSHSSEPAPRAGSPLV